MTAPRCPYCDQDAELVTGDAIFHLRHDLSAKYFWRCEPCDAHVGCHAPGAVVHGSLKSDGTLPLGTLANRELRQARTRVHNAFDWVWRTGRLHRTSAYAWLAGRLDIPINSCHIGTFDLETCNRVIEVMETAKL